MLLEPGAELLVDEAFDHGADFGGDELVLGLGGKFRIGNLHGENAGQAFAGVVTGDGDLFLFGDAGGRGIGVDDAGERAAEAGEMGAAVALGNVVGEAEHVLVVAVVPPEGAFHREAILLAADHDGILDGGLLGAVEVADEGLDAAFVIELHILGLDAAMVAQQDAHAGIEEGEFAQAMLDGGEIKFGLGEGLRGWAGR